MAHPPFYLAAPYPPVCLTNRCEPTGADERIRLRWKRQDEVREVLRSEPITSHLFELEAWRGSYLLPKAEFDALMRAREDD